MLQKIPEAVSASGVAGAGVADKCFLLLDFCLRGFNCQSKHGWMNY